MTLKSSRSCLYAIFKFDNKKAISMRQPFALYYKSYCELNHTECGVEAEKNYSLHS